MSQLEKLDADESESSPGSNARVYNALSQLLTYMPLLDIVDTKCKSVGLFSYRVFGGRLWESYLEVK